MTVSTAGDTITMRDGRLEVPSQPVIPFIEGDGTGPDIWRASQHVFDAAVRRAYGGKRQHRLARGPRRREGQEPAQQLAARRDPGGHRPAPRGHQGPAHHAGRRRLPLAQRGAPPEARSLRLRPSGALVRGRALAGQGAAGREHGHLPREHRGHLRRHRVQGRDATRPAGWSTSSGSRWARRRSGSPTPAPSASSRSRRKAPSASSGARSTTPSPGSRPA